MQNGSATLDMQVQHLIYKSKQRCIQNAVKDLTFFGRRHLFSQKASS